MKGRSILITGGSGFLGKALIARIYKNNKVVVLSRNEGNLVALKQEFPSIHIVPGNVADSWTVRKALQDVNGVFHLAGFKHVGLAEQNVNECLQTNISGTRTLLHQASRMGIDCVIGTSTDKAAQVAGVYGASKLAMERLFAEAQGMDPSTKYRIVRYGNVLYSTGSVLCKWRDALQAGRPIIISNPEATRFYWTVDAAVDLLFECLDKAVDATPYVPDMKAMRLGDILIAMEEKYGQAKEVSTTGLQAGENMHERMMVGGPTSADVPRYTVEEIIRMV
jgi:UDP-N-acetylglucosamine 4,6-dehydratase